MVPAVSAKRLAVRRARPIAATIAGAFLLFGAMWVLVSDVLLYRYAANHGLIARFETAKGWLFVLLSAAGVYALTRWAIHGLAVSDAMNAAIVSSIGEGVLVLGKDGVISGANPAAARILGVPKASELVGISAEEFTRRFHITDATGRIVMPDRLISQRALTGERPPPYKAHMFPASRAPVTIIATTAPVQAEPGAEIEASVSIMRDVTEVEQLDTMRDQFFATAAHELKTPITVLKAQVDVLGLSTNVPARMREMLDRQCGRLERKADAILTLVRLRSGTLHLYPTRVEVAELVREVGREMAVASADHPVATEMHARPIVFGDPERMAQALRSMIEIAYRRVRPHAGIVLSLDETDGHAAVSVSYEPLGIDEAAGFEDADLDSRINVDDRIAVALVEATGGHLGSRSERDRRTDVAEFPTMLEGRGA